MFEVGFSEYLLIAVIALVVLGPERLPKLVAQVGRWFGKARAMARQFREQLESEVNLEEMTKTPPRAQNTPSYPPPGEAPPNEPGMSDSLSTAHMDPAVDPDTVHRPTSDYPYAEPGAPEIVAHHPEADVYGGTAAAEPEYLTPEEADPVAVTAPAAAPDAGVRVDEETPAPLHVPRV
jgi:sec-independent protein translocase protein TatB